ncbi:hypothetical protein OG607_44905 [Streptomyces sp. NBC_01537]|uniref:deazapurine DNA modification protein DpdA family protein n=1 Tax=Streptomyces sp. NBC_01537 TaxID=2903896 RepID=UPI00386DB44D
MFFGDRAEPVEFAPVDVSLFISRNRLKDRKTFPRARAPWALDSGSFTELKDHGRWRITTGRVRRRGAPLRRDHRTAGVGRTARLDVRTLGDLRQEQAPAGSSLGKSAVG